MKTKTIKQPRTVGDVVRRKIKQGPLLDTLSAFGHAVKSGLVLTGTVAIITLGAKSVMNYGQINPTTRVMRQYTDLRKMESAGNGNICVNSKKILFHDFKTGTMDPVVVPDYLKVKVAPVAVVDGQNMSEIIARDPELDKEAVQKALECPKPEANNSGVEKLFRGVKKIYIRIKKFI